MKSISAWRSTLRSTAGHERRGWRAHWVWAIVLVVVLLAVWSVAFAQTQRGNEIIERALMLESNDADGSALYKKMCAACHGKQAHGNPDTLTPALAGQWQRYLIKQLVDFAEGDRVTHEMHRIAAQKELTTPQAMSNLASYLGRLPLSSSNQVGDGKQLGLGKRVYESVCAECHGRQAEGDVTFAVPSLQRQHYSYLLSQTRSLAVGHRYSVDISVIQLLETLSFDQLTAVADYMSRLPSREVQPVSATPE